LENILKDVNESATIGIQQSQYIKSAAEANHPAPEVKFFRLALSRAVTALR
jgi:hypothetical protein